MSLFIYYFIYTHCVHVYPLHGDGIFKLLRSSGTDSKESIPPAYVAYVQCDI